MDQIHEPELTFPPEVAERVRQEYHRASVILEYGSGGSTVLAARKGSGKLFSVESDRTWVANMRAFLSQSCPEASAVVHHADIGPTGDWGAPQHYSKLSALKYLNYSRSVWRRTDFVAPDLVLVDGRFRVGCFLVTLQNIRKTTTILFDDYTDRPFYRAVEDYLAPGEIIGRMAIFKADPLTRPIRFGLNRLRRELTPL